MIYQSAFHCSASLTAAVAVMQKHFDSLKSLLDDGEKRISVGGQDGSNLL